jgi:hypothetical protein
MEFPTLLQTEGPENTPFICIPGVREYHNHPSHTGDSWLLYRKKAGVGTLGYLIEKLYQYGIVTISNFNLNINTPRMALGIDINALPE